MNINNAIVSTNFTRIINLNVGEDRLRKNFRKSYRSLINQAERKITIKTLNSDNIVENDIKKLYDFHQSIVGKKTRNWSSWSEQYKLVLDEKAVFFEAYAEKKLIGFSFFLCFGKVLFYFSSAFSYESFGSSHSIILQAIKYAITKKCNFFDIGQQVYQDNQNDLNSEKLQSISYFKRGFGGCDQIYLAFQSKKNIEI